jgi:hypothetical protein
MVCVIIVPLVCAVRIGTAKKLGPPPRKTRENADSGGLCNRGNRTFQGLVNSECSKAGAHLCRLVFGHNRPTFHAQIAIFLLSDRQDSLPQQAKDSSVLPSDGGMQVNGLT